MKIITELIEKAEQELSSSNGDLRVDNIILGKTIYTMKGCDKVFIDMNLCLVLFENSYGFSYFQDEIDYSLSRFVNKDALKTLKEDIPIYLKVAITDGAYGLINSSKFTDKLLFTGNIRQKAQKRAKVLLEDIPGQSKVLLLGAATEIIEEAEAKECKLKILDLEDQKVGLKFSSTYIENGEKTDITKEIKETDYIVATGMIFVTETADEIFKLANLYNKKLILFMETGSNFGPQLLEYGANTVISEFFPYYDFFGETKYIKSRK